MQWNAMQYNAMQCNAMQYNTIQYNTLQYLLFNDIYYQYNTLKPIRLSHKLVSKMTILFPFGSKRKRLPHF